MMEQLTNEELTNCVQLLTSEQRESQEIGFAIFTAYNFDDFEITMTVLNLWKGWLIDKNKNSGCYVERIHYYKPFLGERIYMTFEPSRLSVHVSFGADVRKEQRIWLNNIKQSDIERFKNNAANFIKNKKRTFQL